MLLIIFGGIFVLGISIFIHELGHLLCGKLVGVEARIFSIGYGKGVWKKRIGKTIYQITAFPLGGYVLFKGDRVGGRLKGVKGELLSTPPLPRMIPVLGGPLFNLFLGFGIYMFLAMVGEKYPTNQIFIDPQNKDFSSAYKAGLRSGDKILSVNGKPTERFEDIFLGVTLSKGEEIQIEYERDGQEFSLKMLPDVFEGGRPSIGIEPVANRTVVVTFTYMEQLNHAVKSFFSGYQVEDSETKKVKAQYQNLKQRAIQFLKDGDEILTVGGKEVHTIRELQTTLAEYASSEATIKVNRRKHPLLTPLSKEEFEVNVPVLGSQIIELRMIQDKEFPDLKIPQYSLIAHEPNIDQKLNLLKVDGKEFSDFSELFNYLQSREDKEVVVQIRDMDFIAKYSLRSIGLLGFQADMRFDFETSPGVGFFTAFSVSSGKVWENVGITFRAMGLMFRGALSPKDNLTGPVGILHAAGQVVSHGMHAYLEFFARISIALMIVNLLPIPVADGGHLVLYFYEAVAGKPLSPRIIEFIFKIGLIFLLSLAMYVTFHDILRPFR
jgi:regulator of sigma E protease